MQDLLFKALDILDREIGQEGLRLSLVICGAFAIHLQGFDRIEQTQDIDSINPISDELHAIITRVGLQLGLSERWLNDQASDISLPSDALKRTLRIKKWNNIDAEVLGRIDLIALKSAAFYSRGSYTLKDWEDLELLKPTSAEIEFAISYMREHSAPDRSVPLKFHKEFEEVLNELRKLAK